MRKYRWRRGFDKERWLSDVVDGPTDDDFVAELLRHVNDECSGTVKFYRSDKGWGGIESAQTPADVWVHFSNIEGEGDTGASKPETMLCFGGSQRFRTAGGASLSGFERSMPEVDRVAPKADRLDGQEASTTIP